MYDLDVAQYTEQELLNAIGSTQEIKDLDEPGLMEIVSSFKTRIAGVTSDTNTDLQEVITFADLAHEKLLNYIRERPPVQLPPTNYDVLQSQNQLSGGPHMVTTNKVIPPINTTEYKYPAGVLNPLEKRTVTKIINIDTMFRKNYTTTSSNRFQWTLQQPENKVVAMRLVSVELPIMWYDISEKNNNNRFILHLYNTQKYGDVSHVVTIPSGNYNHLEMADTINQLFINKRGGLEYMYVHIDPVTTKTTFRTAYPQYDDHIYSGLSANIYDSNFTDEYSPDFYYELEFFVDTPTKEAVPVDIRMRKTLGWYLGFRNKKYLVVKGNTIQNTVSNNETFITYQGCLVSETSFGSGRGHYVYISVNDYNRNCLTETISSHTGDVYVGNNILGRISVTTPSNEVMMTTPADRIFKQRDYLGPVTLHKFTIEILNRFGDLIDLNNNDFSLSLELTVLY